MHILEWEYMNMPALIHIMAWCRPGEKPLSEPMMVSLLTHICVIWPQRVKTTTTFPRDKKLTFWCRDHMAAILQTTFPIWFVRIAILNFSFKCYHDLFPIGQLTITQVLVQIKHWRHSIFWTNNDLLYGRMYKSLSLYLSTEVYCGIMATSFFHNYLAESFEICLRCLSIPRPLANIR